MLEFKTILNKDPAIILISLFPNNIFKFLPINKRMYQDIDDCSDDKILKPKILFCGKSNLVMNFIYLFSETLIPN